MSELKRILDFTIPEQPSWREEHKPTSEKLKDIIRWRKQYDALTEEDKQFCEKRFARIMAIKYVYESNVGESVGTQTYEDTKEILECLMTKKNVQREWTTKEKETINTEKALRRMHELHAQSEMDHTGMLTVQQICDIHNILLNGLRTLQDEGNLRQTDAYTKRPNGDTHCYPEPEQIEAMIYAAIDEHNIHMEYMPSVTSMETRIPYIIKSAAWLLARFVTIHPFGDGNGRLCRLLANYVLSLVTPFPVHVYQTANVERLVYLNAIIQCQDDDSNPLDLAALLVDSIWIGWDSLFKSLETWKKSKQNISIIIRWSKLEEEVKRIRKEGKLPNEILELVNEEVEKLKINENFNAESNQDGYIDIPLLPDEQLKNGKPQYTLKIFKKKQTYSL